MNMGGPEAVDVENEPWGPLQPYLTGGESQNPGPHDFGRPDLNYNWLDWGQNIANGMPVAPPPMSMDDPRLTFENVYTPYAGGPWNLGMGPGELTTEAGIPTHSSYAQQKTPGFGPPEFWGGQPYPAAPGSPAAPSVAAGGPGPGTFIPPPEGFTPGAPGANEPPPPEPTSPGGSLSAEVLRRAQNFYDRAARWERDANEGYGSPWSMNDILATLMEDPELTGRDLRNAVNRTMLGRRGASY